MVDPVPGDLAEVAAAFDRSRRRLAAAEPDAIVFVASDHFRQLVTSNMPAFMVGKAPSMRGTHPNEVREFGLPVREVPGDPDLARDLLGRHQLPDGFDFAFSDEPWLDHAFMVPLLYLRPQLDVPLVPIFTNCNAPPLPGAARFAALGEHIRTTIQRSSLERRVAVLATGHLAFELGGPRQLSGGSPGPDFDEEALGWIRAGDVAGAVAGCTYERLLDAGNLTFQFLNFIALMAAAGAGPPELAEAVHCRFGPEPFMTWGST
jgi:aromatic ring-opening dioxygenase catalytic subunit (LigB family)